MKKKVVVPYKNEESGKKKQVARMFNNISQRYDFLNHFLSLGIDIIWRKKAIGLLKKLEPKKVLDIATGTGDLAIEALKTGCVKVEGIDISEGMIEVGKKKIVKKGLTGRVELMIGDSENIKFPDNNFDAATVGFGVRNFENLEKGISEIYRVLAPGGKFIVLEFSKPRKFPVKQLYNFYFKNILPILGKMISKDDSAYTYLPESVHSFKEGEGFLEVLREAGFKNTEWKPLTFGIASIYIAQK